MENTKNIKNTWKGIKSIINTQNSSSSTISKVSDTPQEISESLNNFFVNVGPNTERIIPITPSDNYPPEKYLKNGNQLTFIRVIYLLKMS